MLVHNIKERCKERRISLNEVERLAGIGKNTIYRWDKNRPSIDRVLKVAAVLGVTAAELLKEEPA